MMWFALHRGNVFKIIRLMVFLAARIGVEHQIYLSRMRTISFLSTI